MSQIASFYLLKGDRRQELSGGGCSGRGLYGQSGTGVRVSWIWMSVFPAPQAEDTLDCALLKGELASNVLAALREQDSSRSWPLKLPQTGILPTEGGAKRA